MWLKVGLAYLAFVMIGANDGAFGVILPSLQNTYGIGKSTASLIFLFGTTGYLLAAFASGLLVERLGRRLFLTLGPVIFMLGAAGMAAALGFPPSLASVFVMSFGVAIIDAGLNSYIAGFPNNTGLLNYLHAFYGLGALIGPVVASGLIALGLPWPGVYVVWMAVSVPVALGLWLALRGERGEAHQDGAAGGAPKAANGGNVLASALRLRVVWLGAVFLLIYVGCELSLGNWSYSLLTQERAQAPLIAAWTVSGFWMGLTLGRLVLGGLARRIGDKAMVQGCLVGVMAGLLLVWLPPREITQLSTATGIVGLWLAGFSLGPIFPTTIAVMSRLVPGRVLPSAIGFITSAGSAGAALFPWVAGNLAEQAGLWVLMPYVIVLSLLLQACWWLLQAAPEVG